jgi:hypothetical protein
MKVRVQLKDKLKEDDIVESEFPILEKTEDHIDIQWSPSTPEHVKQELNTSISSLAKFLER